jgi:hypothetical protein
MLLPRRLRMGMHMGSVGINTDFFKVPVGKGVAV